MVNFSCLILLGDVCYTLLDEGVANALALESLTHGTNPISYVAIRIFGGDPKKGGAAFGATRGIAPEKVKNPKGYFFVFKDRQFERILYEDGKCTPIGVMLRKRLNPRLMAAFSGANLIGLLGSDVLLKFMGGAANFFITPTLKFRFSAIDPKRFQEDESMQNPEWGAIAYKTTQKVEAWRIGLLGSLLTGVNGEWLTRAKNHPSRVVTGVIQLIVCVSLVIFFADKIMKDPTPVIVGALLA